MVSPGRYVTRPSIALFGATGKVGQALTSRLVGEGRALTVVGRDRRRLETLGCPDVRVADFGDPVAVRDASLGAEIIVSCAHARFVPAILDAAPNTVSQFVLVGSTRRFTRFPDPAAEEVRAAETAFLRSGRAGVMLHPTMIFGAQAENNLQRIAKLLRLCPVVPLPGGGHSLVQPVHIDDVVACLTAAIDRSAVDSAAVVIAGPEPVTYAELVRSIAARLRRKTLIVPLPEFALLGLAGLTRAGPGLPSIQSAEIRRLAEDKAFDIAEMRRRLGVTPMPLAEGLARTFG